MRAHLPASWEKGELNIKAPLPYRITKTRDATTPIVHIHSIGKEFKEEFDATNIEAQPGHRLIDMYEDRIDIRLKAPPKKHKDDLEEWIKDYLEPTVKLATNEYGYRAVFSDGSMKKKFTQRRPDGVKSGSACLVVYNDEAGIEKIIERKTGCGQVTAFDAEMLAIWMGINVATNTPGVHKHMFVFADNKGALERILNPRIGPSQNATLLACAKIRKWFEADHERTIHLIWCPGHVGITLNEKVDELAKERAELIQPDVESYSMIKERITKFEVDLWRQRMKESKKYKRYGLLDGDNPKTLSQIKHTSDNWFIKHSGGKNREMGRMVRLISGHAPIGAYQTWFNLPGPTSCWYCWHSEGKQVLETQDHILYECKGWGRGYWLKEIHVEGHPKYNKDIPRYRLRHDHEIWEMHALSREASGVQRDIDEIHDLHGDINFRKSILDKDWENFGHFIRLNPMVETFEWSDLVEKAFEDAMNGLDYTTSVHIWKSLMHTRLRRQYREEYIENLETQCANKYAKEVKEFNHKQRLRNDQRDPTRWHAVTTASVEAPKTASLQIEYTTADKSFAMLKLPNHGVPQSRRGQIHSSWTNARHF